MTDQDNNGKKPGAAGPEPVSPAEGPVEDPVDTEVVVDPGAAQAEAKERALNVSEQLRRALEEAEASVARRESAGAEAEPPMEGGEEEVEVELMDGETGADFDPNRVEPVREPAPEPPTKKEQELKLQILDLRQQLREKDKEVEIKIKEMKQNADQAKMLQKNFDGYKMRVQREKADWFNYGHEPVMKELLPVIDNFERALAHAGDTEAAQAIAEGVKMIHQQLLSVLSKFGVTPVDMEGQSFNPELHQAVAQVERADLPAGSIVELHQKGYMMKDRLLRPAMVVVSKQPDKKDDIMDSPEFTDE